MGNSLLEATRSQEICWKWVEKEIGSLKDGIKGIVETFTESLGPNKTEKIMSMIQKISQDVETMKVDQEHRIEKMEEDASEIKENLNNLVEISRQMMNNSADGLEKNNSMITDYRTRTNTSEPPLGEKQKKIASEGGKSATGGKTSSGPCTRTRSRTQGQ